MFDVIAIPLNLRSGGQVNRKGGGAQLQRRRGGGGAVWVGRRSPPAWPLPCLSVQTITAAFHCASPRLEAGRVAVEPALLLRTLSRASPPSARALRLSSAMASRSSIDPGAWTMPTCRYGRFACSVPTTSMRSALDWNDGSRGAPALAWGSNRYWKAQPARTSGTAIQSCSRHIELAPRA